MEQQLSTPTTLMVCSRKLTIKLNSLESIWYCVFVVVVTLFLCLDGTRHYAHYDKLDWPQGKPTSELNLYIVLMLSAFLLIILFIPTQIFKVGNRANDQGKLGLLKNSNDTNNGRFNTSLTTSGRRVVKYLQAIRRVTKHLGPVGATLHFISAFCLLLPLMFLQARAIQYGLLTSDAIWRSEVLVGVTSLQQYEQLAKSTNSTGGYFPAGSNQTASQIIPTVDPFKVYMVTLNYINYIIPLFYYGVRYADVFWLCHKGFAFIFSLQLMLNAIQYALGFIGFSLLYKLHWYGWYNYGMKATPVFSQPTGIVAVYLTNNITVFMSAVITYMYGYSRLKMAEYKHRAAQTKIAVHPTTIPLKCNGYMTNVAAAMVLVVFIACKVPLTVEYFGVYQASNDARLLGCMVFDTIYMVFWAVMWIGFTLKPNWNFTIHPSSSTPSLGCTCDDRPTSNSVYNTKPDIELAGLGNPARIADGPAGDAETFRCSWTPQQQAPSTPSSYEYAPPPHDPKQYPPKVEPPANCSPHEYTQFAASGAGSQLQQVIAGYATTTSSPKRAHQTPNHHYHKGIARSPHRTSDHGMEEEALLFPSAEDECLNRNMPQSSLTSSDNEMSQ